MSGKLLAVPGWESPGVRARGKPYNGAKESYLPVARPKLAGRVVPTSTPRPSMLTKSPRVRLFFGLLVAVTLFGCREAESVSSYETERAGPRPNAVDVEEVRGSLDHMLAAIVPQGDDAWFFKLVTRGDSVEELRKPFEEFVGSVELGEKGATPAWKLPAGWVQKAGGEMRAATIEAPHKGETLELAVSTLPLSGKWEAYVTRNVNRWLGQLQQGELSEKLVTGLTKSLPFKGGEATLVELVGVMQPMAGTMPPGHPVVGSGVPAATAGSSRPGDSTPRAAKPQAADLRQAAGGPMGVAVEVAAEFAKPVEFTYEPPASWQPGQTSSMRKAAFVVADGGKQAGVTVTQFPASGAMSDPTAQAQRWAREAGLELSEGELKAAATDVTIDGTAGQQFELLGPEGDAALGVLAAMVRRGDQMWFFKMTGDRALVATQGEAFAKFLESVKFAE